MKTIQEIGTHVMQKMEQWYENVEALDGKETRQAFNKVGISIKEQRKDYLRFEPMGSHGWSLDWYGEAYFKDEKLVVKFSPKVNNVYILDEEVVSDYPLDKKAYGKVKMLLLNWKNELEERKEIMVNEPENANNAGFKYIDGENGEWAMFEDKNGHIGSIKKFRNGEYKIFGHLYRNEICELS